MKKLLSIVTVMLLLSVSGVSIVFADATNPDVVTITAKDIESIYFDELSNSKLPDVIVEYKNGVCIVKNMPSFTHPEYGKNTAYSYEVNGGNGIFAAWALPENNPHSYGYGYPCIIDANKTPVSCRFINTGEDPPDQVKILNNGVTVRLESDKVMLYKPDAVTVLALPYKVSSKYNYITFNVDYNAKTEQYALLYARYKKSDKSIWNSDMQAGVVLLDKEGKHIKQFLLQNMYFISWYQYNPTDMGYPVFFYRCAFSKDDPTKLYLNGITDDPTMENFYSYFGSAIDIYEIDLEKENCKLINEKTYQAGINNPQLPFTIEYNKQGTRIYTEENGKHKTLKTLYGDYVATSYSINHDGSGQVIFVSEKKRASYIRYKHPINTQ